MDGRVHPWSKPIQRLMPQDIRPFLAVSRKKVRGNSRAAFMGGEHSARNLLGHGYVLAFGDTAIFVQHTSTRVITFEDAMNMAKCVLRNHPSSGLIQ